MAGRKATREDVPSPARAAAGEAGGHRHACRLLPPHLLAQRGRQLLSGLRRQAQLQVHAGQARSKGGELHPQVEEERACGSERVGGRVAGWCGGLVRSGRKGVTSVAALPCPVSSHVPYRSFWGTWWRRPASITSGSRQPCGGREGGDAQSTRFCRASKLTHPCDSQGQLPGAHVASALLDLPAAGRCPPPACSQAGGGTGRRWARCGARSERQTAAARPAGTAAAAGAGAG